jgi:hypothetical protein
MRTDVHQRMAFFALAATAQRVTLYAQRRPMAQCKMQALKSLSPLHNQIISSMDVEQAGSF